MHGASTVFDSSVRGSKQVAARPAPSRGSEAPGQGGRRRQLRKVGIEMTTSNSDMTVFALAGGGNLGAVQVGMLYALVEAGITPDAIVGTSIGAMNGAYLANHVDLDGIEQLADMWASVKRHDLFPMSMRGVAKGLVGRRAYLFDSFALRTLISRAHLGFSNLEDAPIPLHVVATDLATGDVVVLSEGSTTDALLASGAIPGVFPPVEIDGRLLVDGGVVANVPVLEAESLGASRIFVLPTLPDVIETMPSNAPAMMQRAMVLASRPAQRAALEEVGSRTDVHVLPAPSSAGHLSIFDFGSTRDLVDEAYEMSVAWLKDPSESLGARAAFRSGATPEQRPDSPLDASAGRRDTWSRPEIWEPSQPGRVVA